VKLPTPLHKGFLLKRYKRFLADVELDDGAVVTAHTPNTGSMLQCAVPGHEVLISVSENRARKLPYTLELIRVNGYWVDTNTQRANRVVEEGLRCGNVRGFEGCLVNPEFRFGKSRIDFMLQSDQFRALLEVKNVTLLDGSGRACFPDAVTVRGQKHLRELISAAEQGWRAIIFFLVQRGEADAFAPADHIDAEYGRLLRQAIEQGVEAVAMRTRVSQDEVSLDCSIPVEI